MFVICDWIYMYQRRKCKVIRIYQKYIFNAKNIGLNDIKNQLSFIEKKKKSFNLVNTLKGILEKYLNITIYFINKRFNDKD